MQALLASSALTDLVGDRVKWERLDQDSQLPGVVLLQAASRPRSYTQKRRVPLTAYIVQIDCWAETSTEASAVKAAVIAVLDGLKTRPLQAFIEADRSGWSPAAGPGAENTSDLYRASLDVRLWHHETA